MDTEEYEEEYEEEVVEEVRYKLTSLNLVPCAGLLAGPMNRELRSHYSQQFSVHLHQYS